MVIGKERSDLQNCTEYQSAHSAFGNKIRSELEREFLLDDHNKVVSETPVIL